MGCSRSEPLWIVEVGLATPLSLLWLGAAPSLWPALVRGEAWPYLAGGGLLAALWVGLLSDSLDALRPWRLLVLASGLLALVAALTWIVLGTLLEPQEVPRALILLVTAPALVPALHQLGRALRTLRRARPAATEGGATRITPSAVLPPPRSP